jgi:phosphopantothenoylcysteine decarboxylase/phosphopantothenate--cysteine ligase
MGYAVAQAAAEAGAEVTLVSGATSLAPPAGVKRIDVVTASDMHRAVMTQVKDADVFIAVAAVADYRPSDPKPHKIKRGNGHLNLDLAPNPDILADVAALKGPFCVGFAAETEDLMANAQAKRRKKGIPLLAANLANETFGKDTKALTLFDDSGVHELPRAPKIALARALVEHIAKMLPRR